MAITRRPLLFAVVAMEVAVAGGCVVAGAQVLRPGPAAGLRQVSQAPAPAGVPPVPSPLPLLTAPARPAPAWPSLGVGLIDRLNHDDYAVYRGQWSVIDLLMRGIRRVVEEQVVPSIKSSLK